MNNIDMFFLLFHVLFTPLYIGYILKWIYDRTLTELQACYLVFGIVLLIAKLKGLN